MAKSLSISGAIADGFRGYFRNFLMLTVAGAIVSSVWLIDSNSVNKLNSARTFVKHELPQSNNAHEAWEKTKGFSFSWSEKYKIDTPGEALLALLVMFLFMYLQIGMARFCMQVTGKGKPSFGAFLSTPSQYLRILGVFCVVFALGLAFGAVLGIAGVILGWFQVPTSIILLVGAVLFCMFMVYLLYFSLVNWCLVDKVKGVMGLMACSKKAISGNLGSMFGFTVVFGLVLLVCKGLLLMLLSPVVGMVPLNGLDYFFASTFIAPIMYMCWTSAYRQLA